MIKHAAGDDPIRSVLVVDVDRDHPSDVALNIARAFAAARERCVLIDTNVRQTAGEGPGLFDLISDSGIAVDFSAGAEGYAVVQPGQHGDPDMLATPALGEAIDTVLDNFDIAIVTCDVFPSSGDAVAIAPVVDAVIIVISAGVTRREQAIQARDALERVGARFLGMVMIERPRRWF